MASRDKKELRAVEQSVVGRFNWNEKQGNKKLIMMERRKEGRKGGKGGRKKGRKEGKRKKDEQNELFQSDSQ